MKNSSASPRRDLHSPRIRKAAAFAASLTLLSGLLLSCLTPFSQAAPQSGALTATVRLPGHLLPEAARRAAPLGRQRGTDSVTLTLALTPRDPAGLDRLLHDLYSPGSPQFHRFIAPDEFARRFSPTPQTYESVAAFARAGGLTVTGTWPSRLLLEVAGPASSVEAAFHVRLQNYAAPDGRVFHAPDAEPSVPLALSGKLAGVIGLQNSAVWHTHLQHPQLSPLTAGIGSGSLGGLTPSDIKAAYSLSKTNLTGAGRTLALFELDGYTASDIAAYETAYGLPAVPLQNIFVGGASGVPGDGAGEVTLDIELMTALAPGVTAIRVYEAPNSVDGLLAGYQQIAQDNIAKEVSTSWGIPESGLDQATLNAENTIFKQMATQGQSFYAAAGDSGAYDDGANISVDDPASQPYVTGVGGTNLTVVAPGGAYVSETTWNTPTDTQRSPFGSGGGGGISTIWPLPNYQTGVIGLGSHTQRNVPDVSLNADPNTGYSIYYTDPLFGSGFTVYGGTSCASPLWAAFTALANQQRAINLESSLGFANAAIYQIGTGTSYRSGFHDIADGSTNLSYIATTGYDNATGWGTFKGEGLLALFAPPVVVAANPVSTLTITPSSVVGGLTAAGTVTLANPAPAAGATVTLTVAAGPVSVPATVSVPAGATSADFIVTTSAVTAAVTESITAAYSGGSQSAPLSVVPAPAIITPASLSLNPASVGGGASSTATVTLSGPAPTAGLTVTLASSDPAVTLPATVTVPAGAVTAQFPVTTVPVTTQVNAVLSATLNSVTQRATLTVQAPELEPITLSPVSVTGGIPVTATLTLTFPAPASGAVVVLTSSAASAVIPASATIPAGKTTAVVTITTSPVPVTAAVNLTATYAGVTKKAVLTVNAILPVGLTLAPASVIGGASSLGTITLSAPAPAGGLTAALISSDPTAQVPATVTFPSGAVSASFTISTTVVSASVSAKVTATLNGVAQSAVLTVQPVEIASLTLSTTSVLTGTPSTGTLTLNSPAPTGGLTVALSSSSTAAAVPATLAFAAGSATATFTVTTSHAGSAVITALLSGASQTATLSVTAAPGTTYPAGLSLISAPYDYSGAALDTLFGYTGVVLATWQPSTGAYALTPTAPAETLHLGRGYWVNLPAVVTLSSVGTPASTTQDFTIALAPGWNQIGDPFPASIRLGNITVSSGSAPVPYDQATTAAPLLVSGLVYRYTQKQGTTAAGYIWVRDTDSLQPGLGYWIYAYQAVTLTIPHP